jgi:hypothetical protein
MATLTHETARPEGSLVEKRNPQSRFSTSRVARLGSRGRMEMTVIAPLSGVSLGTGSNGYFPIRLDTRPRNSAR